MSHGDPYPHGFFQPTIPVTFYDRVKPLTASVLELPALPNLYSATRIASESPVVKPVDETNPKDRAGAAKVDLSLFPPAGLIHGAHALVDGATKYGPYNWREKKVRARVYIAAAMRHLQSFLDREDVADDSGVHHLGHAMACCAIILDAVETGNLVDDRPVKGAASALLARLNTVILERQAAKA